MRVAFVFMLAVAAAPLAAQQAPAAAATPPQIVVSGVGRVRAMPDLATIDLGVETQASTAKAAAAENADKQNAVLAGLKKLGVPGQDVTTSSFAVRQDRNDEGVPLPQYTATNIVEVRTHDLTMVGQIIDAALAAGANRVEDVDFSVSKPEPLQEKALALAVEQARRQAEVVAKAAGGELGPVIELSTEGDRPLYRTVALQELRVSPLDTPISPREQVITASIVGRWQFVQR